MVAVLQVMALKYINAPQSTGVAVGSAEFVRRMKLHTFMAFETPHFGPDAWGANEGEFVAFNNAWHVRGIGRTHKVTRADMVGALVALDAWVARDHAARLTEAHKQCERLCEALAGVPGVQTTIDETNTESFDAYGVDIALDSAVLGEGDDGLDAMEMIARLKSGEPSIWARPTRRDSAGPMEVSSNGPDCHFLIPLSIPILNLSAASRLQRVPPN